MHAAALLKMHQVWRGVHPGPVTGLQGHRLQRAQVEPLPLVPATVITGHGMVNCRRWATSRTR